jgi:hypothetical protein
LRISHQASGWCDKELVIEYLKWLRKRRPGCQRLVLIWDAFSAHGDQTVRETATRLNIQLIFIPPGMTDKLQPLDHRIFGSLKARAKAPIIRHFGGDHNLFQSVQMMMESWDKMGEDERLDSWDYLLDISRE